MKTKIQDEVKIKTNKEIIQYAQAQIFARGELWDYSLEQQVRDAELIGELELLKLKYK